MKLTGFFILLALNLVLAISAGAQALTAENLQQVQVDAISDAEIQAYYQKAKATGLSDEQLFKIASDRGLPAEQLAKLKIRIMNLSGGTTAKAAVVPTETPDRSLSPEAAKLSMKKLNRDLSVFGAELFSEASTIFEPNLKLATPAGYTLGPGDEMVIQVFGYSEQTYKPIINAEGNIYIPNVGPIAVAGLSVDEASAKVKNKLASTIYKAIRTGQTKVQVSLGNIRSIMVTVIGQASRPGTYTVPSLTTLFNLLYICGGPSAMGSFRQIELLRGGKVLRTVDLYSFLLRGDRKDNLLLQDQDVVRIPYYLSRVSIDGEVRRRAMFEMQPNESVDQLLTYCGGFGDSAYRGQIKMVRITDTGRMLLDISQDDFASTITKTGDAYMVGKALDRFSNRVTIRGAVMRPGDYELKPGMEVKDLIASAGGLRQDAYKNHGVISRLEQDLTPSSVSFNVGAVADGKQQVALKREDVVTITSIFELKDLQTIDVNGEVRKPGKISYRENLTLKDVLLLAGGFAEGANSTVVEISRRLGTVDVASESYQQTELIKVNLADGLNSEAANVELKPYDLVLVRPKGDYERQRTVFLSGQVLSPGQYVLESSRERISTLIKRSGGFKSSADSSSIAIRRVSSFGLTGEERERTLQRLLSISRDSLINNPELRDTYMRNVDFLSVNVQTIKDDPGGPEDIILEDGDYIEIARASSLVRVSGEVFHPSLLPYEKGANAHYYIKRSGNFTSLARRSRAFVIYPDGRAKSVKKFFWIKSYPSVTPRSEIYIPSKEKEGKKALTTGEWIAISSIMATITTMVVTIINAK